MKKAVIMCRVSSDEQAKGYSLDIQFENLTKHCLRNEIEIVQHYREDYSAKNFKRPEFKKFMAYARANRGKIDVLLITTWDRFSRNLTDSLIIIRQLENLGIVVNAIEQPIDMTIPENKAMLAMHLAIPEIENERRSIKITGGMRAALKSGRLSRRAPMGYSNERDEDDKPIIVPNDKAPFIQYAFQRISEGITMADVIRELKTMGYTISDNGMSVMIRNMVYKGKLHIKAYKGEEEQIVHGIHEPLISCTLFDKVQDIVDKRKSRTRRPTQMLADPNLPLRGVLECSQCKAKLTGSGSRSGTNRRYYYYHCNECRKERYRADWANSEVESILEGFQFSSPFNKLFNEIEKDVFGTSSKTKAKKIKELEKKLDTVNTRIEKLQDLLLDSKIEMVEFEKMNQRNGLQKDEIISELGKLKSSNSEIKSKINQGIKIQSKIAESYAIATTIEKNLILSSIFPEKFSFANKKCRTIRMNESILKTLSVSKGLKRSKKGIFTSKSQISLRVEMQGIEPWSKRGS